MQLFVLFNLFELFESSRDTSNEEYKPFTIDRFQRILIRTEEFSEIRVQGMVHEMAALVLEAHTSSSGVFIYQYATIVSVLLAQSSALRSLTRRACASVLRHTLNLNNRKLFLQLQHSRFFFYPMSVAPLQCMLKELIKHD
jgi:hypothetical protein